MLSEDIADPGLRVQRRPGLPVRRPQSADRLGRGCERARVDFFDPDQLVADNLGTVPVMPTGQRVHRGVRATRAGAYAPAGEWSSGPPAASSSAVRISGGRRNGRSSPDHLVLDRLGHSAFEDDLDDRPSPVRGPQPCAWSNATGSRHDPASGAVARCLETRDTFAAGASRYPSPVVAGARWAHDRPDDQRRAARVRRALARQRLRVLLLGPQVLPRGLPGHAGHAQREPHADGVPREHRRDGARASSTSPTSPTTSSTARSAARASCAARTRSSPATSTATARAPSTSSRRCGR